MSFPPPRSMYRVERLGQGVARLVFNSVGDTPTTAVERVGAIVQNVRAVHAFTGLTEVQVEVPPETSPAVRTALRLRLGLEVT